VVADSHHFEEELDPDSQSSKKLDPDPDRHQNDADPQHKWLRSSRSLVGDIPVEFDAEQMAFFSPPSAPRPKWSAIFKPFQAIVSICEGLKRNCFER
jgi:hypothetical protein